MVIPVQLVYFLQSLLLAAVMVLHTQTMVVQVVAAVVQVNLLAQPKQVAQEILLQFRHHKVAMAALKL
jgi:hypothetical protein